MLRFQGLQEQSCGTRGNAPIGLGLLWGQSTLSTIDSGSNQTAQRARVQLSEAGVKRNAISVLAALSMTSTTPGSTYSHPQLILAIQQPPPPLDYDIAVRAVRSAEALGMGHAAGAGAGRAAADTSTGTTATNHKSPTRALAAGSEAAVDAACLLAPVIIGRAERPGFGQDLEVQHEDGGCILPTAARHNQCS